MNVWIDIENLPNVLFFEPIIKELKKRGHNALVTARNYAQLFNLLEVYSIAHTKIGRHYGKNKYLKMAGGVIRSLQMFNWSIGKNIDVAVGFGSRTLALSCFLRKIPNITMYDYEYVSIHLLNKWADKIIVPDAIPVEFVTQRGAKKNKVFQFPGYKEEIYAGRFRYTNNVIENLGIDKSKIIVTIRPPATLAHYHNKKSEMLFANLINIISTNNALEAIIFPRTQAQIKELRRKNLKNVHILTKPVNGLALIWNSDIVISGGGTMIRESAVLGVPAYSFFTGKKAAVDKKLEREGKIVFLSSMDDLKNVEFRKKSTDIDLNQIRKRSRYLINLMVNEVLALNKKQ